MTELTTKYLGFELKNPLLASASPLTGHVDNLKRMEDAGVAAIVLPSVFEEQIELQSMGVSGSNPQANLPEALKHIPNMQEHNQGVNGYLSLIYQAKHAVNVPVIASLNGYYGGGWVQYAKVIEAAGADALELNIYYLPAKPHISGAEIEKMYVDLVRSVKHAIRIPIAVKLSPYFTAVTHMATQLDEAGANALVFFNRFYQPDFDLEKNIVVPSLDLSQSKELRLRLRWVAIVSQYINADLAITGGVHTAEDVVKCMLAGGKVAMMTSALLIHGIPHLQGVLTKLHQWLEEHEIPSIQSIQGKMNQMAANDPSAFERANYLTVLRSGDWG